MALDDLLRYESAAIAAQNVKNEPDISVLAMQSLYKNFGMAEDPIVAKALSESFAGLETGAGITNLGVAQAINVYTKKYETALQSTKVSELTKYLTEGFDIPAEAKSALGKYNELTIADLGKKSKEASKEEQEEIKKLMQTVMLLKERRLRAKTLGIYNNVVKQDLESFYPKKKEEKQEA